MLSYTLLKFETREVGVGFESWGVTLHDDGIAGNVGDLDLVYGCK